MASANFGPASLVRRRWPPPRLAMSEVEIAFKSSTVNSRYRFALATELFLCVDDRMKSPRLASCCRTPRRAAVNPSLSTVCTTPRNAESLLASCCTAWIGAFRSLQSRATCPGYRTGSTSSETCRSSADGTLGQYALCDYNLHSARQCDLGAADAQGRWPIGGVALGIPRLAEEAVQSCLSAGRCN